MSEILQKERPIIYDPSMVISTREGRKTMTRRIIPVDWWRCLDPEEEDDRAQAVPMCPYGVIGERLWVREGWRTPPGLDDNNATQIATLCHEAGWSKAWAPIRYEADSAYLDWDFALNGTEHGRYRTARFMPRFASRMLLEITEVRIEQVQDISMFDAKAEGIERCTMDGQGTQRNGWRDYSGESSGFHSPRASFRSLWDVLNAKRGYSWEHNLWVWVIAFGLVEVRR